MPKRFQKNWLCPRNSSHAADILSIAQSDRERECIRYTAVVASGMSSKAARKCYVFENTSERLRRVNDAIEDSKTIKSAIDGIARLKEKAAFSEFGITISDSVMLNLLMMKALKSLFQRN